MIPAIVTLIVGVAIVIVSFFLTDGPKENTENSVMDESRENLEKKLDEYCDSLVEKKKNEPVSYTHLTLPTNSRV